MKDIEFILLGLLAAIVACLAFVPILGNGDQACMAMNHVSGPAKLMRGGDRRAAVLHGFLQQSRRLPLRPFWSSNLIVNFVIFSLAAWFCNCRKGLGAALLSKSSCSWWASFFYILS